MFSGNGAANNFFLTQYFLQNAVEGQSNRSLAFSIPSAYTIVAFINVDDRYLFVIFINDIIAKLLGVGISYKDVDT